MVLKMEKGWQECSSNFSFSIELFAYSIDASYKKAWTCLPHSFYHSRVEVLHFFLCIFLLCYPGIYDLLSLGYDRVLLCLKRSLRIANAAQQQANVTRGSSGPVTLFVEILNKLVIRALMFLSEIRVQDCSPGFIYYKIHFWSQVPLLFWEGEPSNNAFCNSEPYRVD